MTCKITKDKQISLPAGTLPTSGFRMVHFIPDAGGIVIAPVPVSSVGGTGVKVYAETPRSRQYLSAGHAVNDATRAIGSQPIGQFQMVARAGGEFLIRLVTEADKREKAIADIAFYREIAATEKAKIPGLEADLQRAKSEAAAKVAEVAQMADDMADGADNVDAVKNRLWDLANEFSDVRQAENRLGYCREEVEGCEKRVAKLEASLKS